MIFTCSRLLLISAVGVGIAVSAATVGPTHAQTLAASVATPMEATPPAGLAVSGNHHYLVDARTGKPFFLLADTAWNLNALTDEEIDAYIQDRHSHGFNTIMFCLDFFPQAASENSYGQKAYIGSDKSELNPEYFAHVDRMIARCAADGMYAMVYSMWGGPKAGTMNTYTPEHLHAVGMKLGAHFKRQTNVILVAGGESTPPYVDVERVNAIGDGLKEGCEGKNLVTVHPCSNRSSSQALSKSRWLDFYMSQVKSGHGGEKVEMTKYVADDFLLSDPKPTMVVEHRYEVGTKEDPIIQRRSLYLSVFAGGCGYAYGHNALWQMSPHTAQKWMLSGWPPGVAKWTEALDTAAVSQLAHIKALLYSRPYLERIPDQSVLLSGPGKEIAERVQAARDGAPGKDDATYVMVYMQGQKPVTIRTAVIPAGKLNAFLFDPATGRGEVLKSGFANGGTFVAEPRAGSEDAVVVVDDAGKGYAKPDGGGVK